VMEAARLRTWRQIDWWEETDKYWVTQLHISFWFG